MDELEEQAMATARERQREAAFGLGAVYVGPPNDLEDYDGWSGMFAVSDGTYDVLVLASVPSLPGFQHYSQVDVEVAAELLEGLGARVDNHREDRAVGLVELGQDERGVNLKRYCVGEDLARLLLPRA